MVASPSETREDLLTKSGAGYTVVRHSLAQSRDDGGSVPGVLGQIVTNRKRRALQLYLLLLTVWPWLGAQDQPLPAAVWARALSTDKGRQWTPTNVSETWRDLEELGLVKRRRLARGVIVTPQREDTQVEYTRPAGVKKDFNETYFSLPPEFWTDGWSRSSRSLRSRCCSSSLPVRAKMKTHGSRTRTLLGGTGFRRAQLRVV